MATYILRSDTVKDEEDANYTVYGVTAVDEVGNVLESVEDLFFNKEKAENFVTMCNSEKLEPIHLMDVAEDLLN